MKKLDGRRMARITPTPESLRGLPLEILNRMAANERGLLSHDGLVRIAAEIKRRKDSKN